MPHSVIPGYNAYVQLPQAYRSLSRPSSALDAKAFPLRSFQLDLVGADFVSFVSGFSQKLTHFVAPPLPRGPAFAGLRSEKSGSSQELCRPQFGYIVVCVTLKSPQIKLCTSSVACSQFLCFTVQFSRCSSSLLQGQIEMLTRLGKHFDPLSKK